MTYFNNLGQGRVGFKTPSGGGGVDTDALAFITAAAITDTTQQTAINTLVTQLKTYGIWNKMKALYPFVGGTAAQHRFNLKDPRTVTAAYYIDFIGGGTHNADGYTTNGTTSYAKTFFPGTNLSPNSSSYSIYNRSVTPSTKNIIDIGYFRLDSSYISNLFTTYYDGGYGGRVNSWNSTGLPQTSPQGFYNGNRTNSLEFNHFKNGSKVMTASDNTAGKLQVDYHFHLGCLFINGLYYSDFSTNNYAFAHIGDGLTDTEAANFYTAVQTFQTTLGRQVGVPIVADTDAQAFLNAAVITDQTQVTAITTLVTDLKAANIWTKMKAIYPFVGGTAAQHKWNLKDPRDLNEAFRLSFTGGGSHTIGGYQGNANNAWANTNLNAGSILTNSNVHLSFYSRTAWATTIYSNEITVDGAYGSGTSWLSLRTNNKNGGGISYFSAGNDAVGAGISNTLPGFFIGSETSSSSRKLYRNGNIVATNTTTDGNPLPSANVALLGYSAPGSYSENQCAFASIGFSLTDAEAATLYTAVQAYQTTLNRAV